MIRKFIFNSFLTWFGGIGKSPVCKPGRKTTSERCYCIGKKWKKEKQMALVKTIKDYHSKISWLEAVIENLFEYGSRRSYEAV